MPMHPDRPLVIKTGVQFTTKVRWVTSPAGEGGELSREGSLGSLSEDAAVDAARSLSGEHWCWEGMDTSRDDPSGLECCPHDSVQGWLGICHVPGGSRVLVNPAVRVGSISTSLASCCSAWAMFPASLHGGRLL